MVLDLLPTKDYCFGLVGEMPDGDQEGDAGEYCGDTAVYFGLEGE